MMARYGGLLHTRHAGLIQPVELPVHPVHD